MRWASSLGWRIAELLRAHFACRVRLPEQSSEQDEISGPRIDIHSRNSSPRQGGCLGPAHWAGSKRECSADQFRGRHSVPARIRHIYLRERYFLENFVGAEGAF